MDYRTRDKNIIAGPLRACQILDVELTEVGDQQLSKGKPKPAGNLPTTAQYKALMLCDINPKNKKEMVIQVLGIAKFDDDVDLGKLNGSLCYLKDLQVVHTNREEGIYLMGRYVFFRSYEGMVGDVKVSSLKVKGKNKLTISWLCNGTDSYVKHLNALHEKQQKGDKPLPLKARSPSFFSFSFSSD